jgi:CheY-like chemotaxis protein
MQAVGGLASGIAHDFNNMLGAILGYSEMAQAELAPGTDVRRYIDTIAATGERGKALVAQILTFSQVNRTEPVSVELTAIVKEAIATLAGTTHNRIRFNTSLPARPMVTLGNSTHLYQLVMNLSTNAIQAMPSGGDLNISLSTVEFLEDRIFAGAGSLRGKFHELTVEDQGMGIDQQSLSRIFEPFYSTRARQGGIGLGLAIVHGVALSHGGAIDVQSTPGTGTCFKVYLPQHAGHFPKAKNQADSVIQGEGETILVVDDEPAMLALTEDLLAQMGYEPVGFSSSDAALAAYLAQPDRFDAILTDEDMPEMTGAELTVRLRERSATLPIVIFSGLGGPQFEARAADAGASAVLEKPFRAADLSAVMSTVFGVARRRFRNTT